MKLFNAENTINRGVNYSLDAVFLGLGIFANHGWKIKD